MRSVALLLASAAAVLAPGAMAEDGNLSLGLTVGPALFVLPDVETGIFTQDGTDGTINPTIPNLGIGGTLGVSASVGLGPMGEHDASLGFNAFVSLGRSSLTNVDSFDGPGVVVIPGYTTPDGSTVDLLTDGSGPTSTRTVTAPGVVVVQSESGGVGVTNEWAVSVAPGDTAFAYSAGTLDGPNSAASAYGAIGATDGGIFIGAGDLTGLEITTSVIHDFIYTGGDVTLALAGQNGDWALQGYGGPSYRFLGQRSTTDIDVNIPEVEPAAGVVFPDFNINRVEELMSHYLGGVAGITGSTALENNSVLTLGLEGGVYYTIDSLSGTESYTVANGALVSVPSTTIVNENTAGDAANGIAFAARGNAALTIPVAANRQITFGGQAEYLSRVATVSRGDGTGILASNSYDPAVTGDAGDLLYDTPSSNLPMLSFGSMWNFTGTVSFTGQF